MRSAPRHWYHPFRDWWNRTRLTTKIRKLHESDSFSVIECPDFQGWLSNGALPRAPLVVRIHGSNLFFDRELNRPPSARDHAMEIKTLQRATELSAVSRYAGLRTLELAGIQNRQFSLIYPAVDTGYFAPGSPGAIEPGLVLFVNSLNPKKGIEQLIDAMNVVFTRDSSARLAVIGGSPGASNSYRVELENRVRPEFRHRVEFAGRIPREEVLHWLQRASICCYPSHMETFGIAVVEAMSAGKPVIYTTKGPGPEVVEHNVSGLLCDPMNVDSLASSILKLLADPSHARALGEKARERAAALFNRDKWIQANLEYYRQCLARPPE